MTDIEILQHLWKTYCSCHLGIAKTIRYWWNNSFAIVTSSICEPLAIVTSRWSFILALYLWTLSSSQWRCQPGCFSMAAHGHDRRGIYGCVLLRFRGRIEIDHSYGLRCRALCCHSRHSTPGAGRRGDGRTHSCCAGSGDTNHSSADRIVVNSYNIHLDIFVLHAANTYWILRWMSTMYT